MSKIKSRLGRGLSSLISVSELPVEAEVEEGAPQVQSDRVRDAASGFANPTVPSAPSASPDLPIDQIKPNPHQPRRQFNEPALAELAASLKSNGLIQPIIVRK